MAGWARAGTVIARILDSRAFIWTLLAAPGAWMLIAWWQGLSFYGEVLHASGELGAQLLIASLAVTPLSLALPRWRLTRWLRTRRRYLGVATFGYSLLHAVVYLVRQADVAVILEDAREIWMWTGWAGLGVLLALAATSNDASVRGLRRGWNWLHRLVYIAAVLTFAHWILSAFDPVPGWIHLGVLAAVLALRALLTWVAPQRRIAAGR